MTSLKFSSRSTCEQVLSGVNLEGKVAFITGTTSGIGIPTAKSLALAGAHVILANRNILLSEEEKKEILAEKEDAKVDIINVDLSSLQSVYAATQQFKKMNLPLHILILNAGVFCPDDKVTLDGFERTFAVNHLAHLFVIRELISLLKDSSPSRIVIVSSGSHAHAGIKASDDISTKVSRLFPPADTTENGYKLYAISKMCNVLTAKKLSREYSSSGISTYVLHPGACIPTNIGRTFGLGGRLFFKVAALFTKSLSQGAATTVMCASRPELQEKTGLYWQDCNEAEKAVDPVANDEELQDALYTRSMELLDTFVSKQ